MENIEKELIEDEINTEEEIIDLDYSKEIAFLEVQAEEEKENEEDVIDGIHE